MKERLACGKRRRSCNRAAGALLLAVAVAEIALRVDAVAHELLELLGLGEASCVLAREDEFAVEAHFEDAAGAGLEGDFAEVLAEGLEQLLGEPGGAQHPVALAAVADG